MNRWMHVAGYATLTVLLSAGAAQSLSASNTVFTDDIVDGQVTYADIRDNAMTGKKILNNSITGADLAPGSAGFSQLGAQWTEPVTKTLRGDSVAAEVAMCPSGRTVISGSAFSPSPAAAMMSSQPAGDAWVVTFRNWISAESYIQVRALCVPK